MSVNELTVYEIARAGITRDKNLVEPEDTDGDSFANDGRTFFHLVNASAGAINVTITPVRTLDDQAIDPIIVEIAATGDGDGLDDQFLGPYTGTFEQTDGTVIAICATVTDMLIGAFRLPPAQ